MLSSDCRRGIHRRCEGCDCRSCTCSEPETVETQRPVEKKPVRNSLRAQHREDDRLTDFIVKTFFL